MMKRRTSLRSLLVCFLIGISTVLHGTAAAAEPGGELRVLCYNIHAGIGTDGKLDLKRIADVVEKHKPDIVALQEVDRVTQRTEHVDQAKILGELTGMEHVFGRTIALQGGAYGIAVLSKFPIKSHAMHRLPEQANLEDRGALEVVLETPKSAKIRFICTHLCHISEERRMRQVAKINELFADGDVLTLIAGDFNATPESPTIKAMNEAWTDATDDTPTAPSANPKSKIDYVFYRPKEKLNVRETKVVDERFASDHRPVLCVFGFAQ